MMASVVHDTISARTDLLNKNIIQLISPKEIFIQFPVCSLNYLFKKKFK